MGENIYMLPSDMTLTSRRELLDITTKFSYLMENLFIGKMINAPAMKSHQTTNSNDVQAQKPASTHKNQEPQAITHNEEKIALV